MVRAEDEAAAIEIARQDIYMQNGVWVELRARPFGRLALDPAVQGSLLACPHDAHGFHGRRTRQPDNRGEPLAIEAAGAERTVELRQLAPHRGLGHHAVRSGCVAGQHDVDREVQDDGDRWDAGLCRAPRELAPGVGLHIGGVDDGEMPVAQPQREGRVERRDAGRVAAWFAGSPETSSRNASEERTSDGAKCRAANVDLPLPAAPTRTTRQGSGRTMTGGESIHGMMEPRLMVRTSARPAAAKDGHAEHRDPVVPPRPSCP